ncbi:hypothetical protein ACHAW6_002373 [Cyclotella cf. meneghiniana]
MNELKPNHSDVLVVGGGLTAVQAAQYGKRVCLTSRRQLVERHFDIDTCWFDKRSTNLCISKFYHRSEAERLTALKEARDGGSVPPIYMKDLRKWEENGKLTLVTADPDITVDLEWTNNLFCVRTLASLNVGPDSGNIMGAHRGASIVANSMECKAWLCDEEGGALANPFQLFQDNETTDSESESD